MSTSQPVCLVCGRTQLEIPLLTFAYQNGSYHICPQHLPVLIHNPQMLGDKLPGSAGMSPAEHED